MLLDIFMPKPIPVPLAVLEALSSTMANMRVFAHDSAQQSPHIAEITAFLEVTPILIIGEVANRAMLAPLVAFGKTSKQRERAIPWAYIKEFNSIWLPWAEDRYKGVLGDNIDNFSLSVEMATQFLPKLAVLHSGIKRTIYYIELEPQFLAWTAYSEKIGHCVFVVDNKQTDLLPNKITEMDFQLRPIKEVLSAGWELNRGFIATERFKGSAQEKWVEKDQQ